MVTVRIRLASPLPGAEPVTAEPPLPGPDAAGGWIAPGGGGNTDCDGATGAGSTTRGPEAGGVLISTGCSSRETTRSLPPGSPTRAVITLPVGFSPADTTLSGLVSAVIT